MKDESYLKNRQMVALGELLALISSLWLFTGDGKSSSFLRTGSFGQLKVFFFFKGSDVHTRI